MCPNKLLALLRTFVENGRMIVDDGGAIKLGQYIWLKEDRINYLVHGTGRRGIPDQYYSLASTLLLLRTGWLTHTAYEIRAGLEGVPCVKRQDRISLLVFLMGRKWKKGDYIVYAYVSVSILSLFVGASLIGNSNIYDWELFMREDKEGISYWPQDNVPPQLTEEQADFCSREEAWAAMYRLERQNSCIGVNEEEVIIVD